MGLGPRTQSTEGKGAGLPYTQTLSCLEVQDHETLSDRQHCDTNSTDPDQFSVVITAITVHSFIGHHHNVLVDMHYCFWYAGLTVTSNSRSVQFTWLPGKEKALIYCCGGWKHHFQMTTALGSMIKKQTNFALHFSYSALLLQTMVMHRQINKHKHI